MQYLQMAQTVRQLVGLQGLGPSSVDATGAEGMFLVLVRNSWDSIQNSRKKWKWLRTEGSFNTVVGTGTYMITTIFSPTNRFKRWYEDTFMITVAGKKSPMRFIEYDVFRDRYANATTNTRPYEFTIRPRDSAILIAPSDAVYVITADYHKTNQTLALAADIPELPVDYHMLIVYEAANRYAISIAMSGLYQEYKQLYNEMWGNLLRDQLPKEIFKVSGIA